jgi:hypothetical protein
VVIRLALAIFAPYLKRELNSMAVRIDTSVSSGPLHPGAGPYLTDTGLSFATVMDLPSVLS